ncbi:CHAT domain-containing protein [Actinoplanes sp. NPDC020271]|uniref:CHAT domain-containing protein n=1 Tax=Actinoplanes sp. NPDC020271 TaxID=3363896 RepID=UPI003794607E
MTGPLEEYAVIALAASGNGDLTAAVETLERLPDGSPGRGTLAAALLWPLMANLQVDLRTLRRLGRVLTIAEADPPDTPRWPALRAGAQVTSLMADTLADRITDPHAALAELEKLAAEAGTDNRFEPIFDSARIGLTLLTALHDGDESAYRRLPEQFERMRDRAGPGAKNMPIEPQLELIEALVEAMHARRKGTDLDEALRRAGRAAERLPANDPLRGMVMQHLATLAGDATPEGGTWTMTAQDQALQRGFAAARMLGMGEETDPARIEAAIRHLREAVALVPPDDLNRAFHLTGLAMGLFRRSEVTNSVAGLDEAVTLLTEARRLAGDADHPHWSLINELLDAVQTRLGAAPASEHPVWLDAMRGHTFHVMVQSDLAGAALAAADASRDAVDFARRGLHDRDAAGAIKALDAGRGLALFAATEVGRVGARLRAAGRADLAVRWDAALASGDPERLPTTLRREAFRVLAAQGVPALLDPPGLPEIRRALRDLDADVLVYLVPGERGLPGHAVLAPADGPPSYLTLPNLRPDQDLEVERYLTSAARRDMGPADAGPRPDAAFAGSLDGLCRWAWRAAMGPVVEQYLPRLRNLPAGRPPRIVLVPTGKLALIPWPAARRRDGRYAIESVAVSQVVSARMLCHAAALPPVKLAPTGLIVGDPDTGGVAGDLPAARVEAQAIRRAFYPGARYVGRRMDDSVSPTGPGRADDVRDWLVSSSPGAGAVLHLACHGFASAGRGTAYLLLAGGEKLAAETLGPLLAQAPERQIGLVVLAGCHTGRAISGYDEAFSLGTAFLAAGVRSVLSTLWPIPDAATSVLMFMFHHFLRVERRPVWDALHRAQLWMIDPHREPPEKMPAELRDELARTDPAEVAAWAGFVHWGR